MASPTIHSNTAPASGGSSTSNANTAIGDLVIVFTIERAGAGVPTFTLQSGFTEIHNQAHDDGSTDGRFAIACKIATAAGAQSYQAYTTSTGSPVWWTGLMVLDAGAFDPSLAYRKAGTTSTGTGAPNPPALGVAATAPLALNDYLFIAAAFWHLSASQTLTPTAPTNYTLRGDVAGAATGDVAWSTRALTAVSTTEDPGAYADNQTPNGTSSISIAIPASFAFGKRRQHLYTNNFTSGSAAAFPQNVRAGSLLVARFGRSTNSTPTVTDTQGNTWAIARSHYDAGNDYRLDEWYALAGSTDACSVTVTATGGAGERTIMEYAGPYAASPLDNVNSAIGTSSAPSSGNITPTVDGCLISGYIGADPAQTNFTPGTGFTADDEQNGATNVDTLCESLVQGTAAAQDADGTLSGSFLWLALVVAYKPAPTGQTIAVGQVTETDVAQAVTWAPKRRMVGQVVETDLAQAIARIKSVAVSQALETDIAQAISARKTATIGQVLETDVAFGLVLPAQIIAVGQVVETDIAQPIAWAPKRRLVGQVFETDIAQPITPISGAVPSEVMVVIRDTPASTNIRVLIEDPTTTKVVIGPAPKVAVIQDPAAQPVKVII
jgi:hypothetical protein